MDPQSPKFCIGPLPSLVLVGPSLSHGSDQGVSSVEKVLTFQAPVWTLGPKNSFLVCFCMRVWSLIVASFEAVMFAHFDAIMENVALRTFERTVFSPCPFSLKYLWLRCPL